MKRFFPRFRQKTHATISIAPWKKGNEQMVAGGGSKKPIFGNFSQKTYMPISIFHCSTNGHTRAIETNSFQLLDAWNGAW
jgi:hypothetical protein